MKVLKVIVCTTLIFVISTAQAQIKSTSHDLALPELGDSSSSTFTLQQEHKLGRAWLMSFRSQVHTISDPLLQDYLEHIIYNLATYSELKDRRIDVVIVDNPTINAFAVPGGVVGVHNGLLLYAETEAQLATVLAHELAHLSQRHFARSVEQQQRNSIPNMAGLLAGILLAATAGGDAGMAAIAATQAASLQSQLRYSRLNEQEADRIGMQTMGRANLDPNAAAVMFENMLKATRYYGSRPPEFLLTHPVTESRVSDARNRARQFPRKVYTDNHNYQLMRARVEVSMHENSKDAVNVFRTNLRQGSKHHEADEYGLILALTRSGQYGEAKQRLAPLVKNSPSQIAYIIANADLNIQQGFYQDAITTLREQLALTPGNHPLTMTLAEALTKNNQPQFAEQLLQAHSKLKPNNPDVWYLLAETHGLAGNIVGVHQARAEYFVLNGILDKAQQQLRYALPLVRGDHLTTLRITERIKQIEQLKQSLKKL